jgi:DNA-binding NarL/FixJ family response regulator
MCSPDKLTERQKAILRRRAEGICFKQIASELRVSVKTVEYHWTKIKFLVGFEDVALLTQYALAFGLASWNERVKGNWEI